MTRRILALLAVSFGAWVSSVLPTQAATIDATTCDRADVVTAIGTVSAGDKVQLPACSQTNWSTNLTITKAITLLGAGAGVTVIGDNVTKLDINCSGGDPFLTITPTANERIRVSAFTVIPVAASGGSCGGVGHIHVTGSSQYTGVGSTGGFRLDHITFPSLDSTGVVVTGSTTGRIDHFHCTYTL